jgi:hypothetical protein
MTKRMNWGTLGAAACAALMAGCAATPTVSNNAAKGAAVTCATAGAALKSLAIAGSPGAQKEALKLGAKLMPLCSAPTASAGETAAMAEAFVKLEGLMAQVKGGAK